MESKDERASNGLRGRRPRAAWAAFVDDPDYKPDVKKDMAKEIASWVRKGATVQRVPVQQARDMLAKWVRPEKKTKPKEAAQASLL